jgi:hypothetical protein
LFLSNYPSTLPMLSTSPRTQITNVLELVSTDVESELPNDYLCYLVNEIKVLLFCLNDVLNYSKCPRCVQIINL